MARLPKPGLLVRPVPPHLWWVRKGDTKMTILRKLNQFATYQRTVKELNRLDNRQLADIGIMRDEILTLARGQTK
jgi:uncharacterized protein YjiS (DUF1127 family)